MKNEAGRRRVTLLRSSKRWLEAIPELRRRRDMSEVNILIVGAKGGRRCNHQFRGRGYATNMLGFPYELCPGEPSGLLGDLANCAPVVARETGEQEERARHFAHLTIRGAVHLLGHDPEDDVEAERMEVLERRTLASLASAIPIDSKGRFATRPRMHP